MPYKMVFHVDGGCRNNGYSNAYGAAAAVLENRRGDGYWYKTQALPRGLWHPTPTNQRAEITAIILALEWAIEKSRELDTDPYCITDIYSDSQYAVNCFSQWIARWSRNGWVNSRGVEVANSDLLQDAVPLHNEVFNLGELHYHWVPRHQNAHADRYCNQELDEQENYVY
ncbi:ribonuclease H-like domain-containing protein [Pestalotiopsis sp. NC0098]|nr:ribonuclease H-like domain-containing protein [Pestalotiopsis sp. NC0098]